MLHAHSWVEYARTYSPPGSGTFERFHGDPRTIDRMIHGVTTFVFRCGDTSCGALKTVEALGQAVSS